MADNDDHATLSLNRVIFMRTNDPLFIVDAETGYHQEANPAAVSLLGYTLDELFQKTVTDVLDTDSQLTVRHYLDIPPSHMSEPLQINMRTSDGRAIPVEWSLVACTHSGRSALLVRVRDIRKRLRTEDELRWMIHKIETLKQVTAMVSARGGLNETLRNVLDFVCDTFQMEFGSLYLTESGNGDLLHLVVVRGLPESLLESVSTLPAELVQELLDSVDPIVSERDTTQTAYCQELIHSHGTTYSVSMPIRSRDDPIGLFVLATAGDHRLNDQDLYLLGRIGNEIGEAIAHQKLHEQTRQQLTLMRAFQAISRQISLSRDPEETFSLIGREAMRALGADRFGLYLVEPETDNVRRAWSVGLSQAYIDTVDALYDEIPGSQVITHREPRLIADALNDPTMLPLYDVVKQEGYRSVGLFPMVSQDQTIGTIGFYYDTVHVFRHEEVEIAQTFADELSVFVQNHRLVTRLREAEAWRRLTLEATREAVITGDEEGTIVDANRAACQMFGYERHELLGKPVGLLMREEDQEQHTTAFRRFVQENRESRGLPLPGFGMHRDGSIFPVEISVGGFAVNDRRYVTGFVQDRSEVAQLEARLRQSQKMEAIGTLAGGVAHDFNNILTGVIGYVELSMMKLPADHPIRNNLQKVKALGERAATLTRQLLAFSRQQVLEVKQMDLNVVVAELTSFLNRVIGEDISLRVIPGENLWTVSADRSALEQILMNLCVNSRDAMPEGGELLIETANVVLDEDYVRAHPWARQGRYVVLEVGDTGMGMDAETMEHIFEPFFTTKEVGKGTGLGLAMVYGLVKQHEGFIHVYSEAGEGTIFKIYLPALPGKGMEAFDFHRTETTLPSGHGTVLVVEDEEDLRDLMQSALSQQGYRVLLASNGEEALRVWEGFSGDIDLTIADVVMPKMGGRNLYDRVREQAPDARFLFISGYSVNGIHQRFLLEQGLEFLHKPFTPALLLRRVQLMLAE